MLSKSYKGKIPKEPTIKKLGSSCKETRAETQELFLWTHNVIWRIKLDLEHTGHFFQMPSKNLDFRVKLWYFLSLSFKGVEIDSGAIIWEVVRSMNKWMLHVEKERLQPTDSTHRPPLESFAPTAFCLCWGWHKVTKSNGKLTLCQHNCGWIQACGS